MKYITLLFILFTNVLLSQSNLEQGVKLLQQGMYDEAIQIFKNITNENPNNKTANICLGRATGLNGNVQEAVQIFKNMDRTFPNDYEVKLNLAEAFLWDTKALKAQEIYSQLVEIDSANFTANYGYANAFANTKDYVNALTYINNALSIDGENVNAQISKKYILLGLADQTRPDFNGANKLLDEILLNDPYDKEAIINKGINLINISKLDKAERTLKRLECNSLDSFEVYILLSHLSILQHNNGDAVKYASKALNNVSIDDIDNYLRAALQRINALGADKRFNKAQYFINQVEEKIGANPKLELARARMEIWNNNVETGLSMYDSISTENYELCMGKTEAFMALGEYSSAKEQVEHALTLDPDSRDALSLKEQISAQKKPSLLLETNVSNDIGSNEANELNGTFLLPLSDKHTLRLRTDLRNTQNGIQNTNAKQTTFFLGDEWKVSRKLDVNLSVGAFSYENNINSKNTALLTDTRLNYKLSNKQKIGFTYDRKAFSYSSDLIKSGIISTNIGLYQHFKYHRLPGFYIKYTKSYQSDNNSKNSLFASFYYEISTFPIIKVGANYAKLSYATERSELYFSPESYQFGELFLHFANSYDPKAKFMYKAEFTVGNQKINSSASELTKRINIELGYRLSTQKQLIAGYFNNTASNSTSKGYTFTRYSLKLNVKF